MTSAIVVISRLAKIIADNRYYRDDFGNFGDSGIVSEEA